ncbi:MAG: DEAD/DEAH box helicase family protein [Bacteroidota bacterium]
MDLWHFQKKAKDNLRIALRKNKNVLLIAPTGSGKSVMATDILSAFNKKGGKVLILVDRDQLINQWIGHLRNVGIRPGIIKHGFPPDPLQKIQLATWQSLNNRRNPPADMVMVDEAHEWLDAQKRLRPEYPKSFFIGMTATPWRTDGQSLAEVYSDTVVAATPAELVREGFLVPSRPFVPETGVADMSGVTIGAHGEYIESEAEQVMLDKKIVGNAVDHYKEHADGMIGFVYTVNKKTARFTQQMFNDAGIPCGLVVDDTPTEERMRQISQLKSGELKLISNVYIFVKGTDIPQLQVMIDLCPTNSMTKYLQMAGRFARIYNGKNSFLQLDHAGNLNRHGLYDSDRDYELDPIGGGPANSERAASVKICPDCFLALPSATQQCPNCNYVFESGGKEIDMVEGELKELVHETLYVYVTGMVATYETLGMPVAISLENADDYTDGEHRIKRVGDEFYYYVKRIKTTDHREAVRYLLSNKTGSSRHNQYISWLRYAEQKKYKKTWAVMQYKKVFKKYPPKIVGV